MEKFYKLMWDERFHALSFTAGYLVCCYFRH